MNNFSLIYFINTKISITLQPFIEEEEENKISSASLEFQRGYFNQIRCVFKL